MKKTVALIAMFLVLAACGGGTEKSGESKEYRISLALPENSFQYQSIVMFTNEMAKIEPDMVFKIYPGAQLGEQKQSIELVQSGGLDMTHALASVLENFSPIYSLFTLPYVFKSDDHFKKVMEDPKFFEALQEESAKKEFLPLMILDGGFRNFFGRKKFSTPEDMKGLKFRIPQAAMSAKIVETLGATAVPIPSSEFVAALQQGIIDGGENNPEVLTTAGAGEVAKHYTFTKTQRIPDMVIISKKVWDTFNPQQQKNWRTAAFAAMRQYNNSVSSNYMFHLNKAKNEMKVNVYEVDTTPFEKKLFPIIAEWEAKAPENKSILSIVQASVVK